MRNDRLLPACSFLVSILTIAAPARSQMIRTDSLCDAGHTNRFWSLDESGIVRQWEVVGNALADGDTILTGVPGAGLAYSSVFGLNTFITSEPNSIKSYEGGTWVPHPVSGHAMNLGGANAALFYFTDANHSLGFFDGTAMNTIAQATGAFSAADVAVHMDGTAYVVAGPGSGTATSVQRYDDQGTLLMDAPIDLNTSHAFGSFMLGDVLYVGFGSSNPDYPNSVVPFQFTNGTVTMGTAIPFPDDGTAYYDLASCAAEEADGTADAMAMPRLFAYPNPADHEVRLRFSDRTMSVDLDLMLFDALGRSVPSPTVRTSSEWVLPTAGLPAGIYLLRAFVDGTERYVAPIVVDHR